MKRREEEAARPEDLKYTETHEWVRMAGKDGKDVVIGITDYAVSQLSDLVHIELPKVGEKIEQGSPFGEIESVKTVADLIAPVSGKVAEVNKEVVDKLELLTKEPYEDGWLVKIKMANPKEVEALMSAEEYNSFIETSEEKESGVEAEEEESDEDFM